MAQHQLYWQQLRSVSNSKLWPDSGSASGSNQLGAQLSIPVWHQLWPLLLDHSAVALTAVKQTSKGCEVGMREQLAQTVRSFNSLARCVHCILVCISALCMQWQLHPAH
jgi:hypothetical protein